MEKGHRKLQVGICIAGLLFPLLLGAGNQDFIRGDANGDGSIDISDAIFILLYITGQNDPACMDALDSNDEGSINVVDAIYLFGYFFLGTDSPPPPFPECGTDPTPDDLGCFDHAACP